MGNVQETIAIGADHGGLEMKQKIEEELDRRGIPWEDLGAHALVADDDYPVLSSRVAGRVSRGEFSRGIVICGSGIGASIAANRFHGVRAALCTTREMAELSRKHNNANVLALGGRLTDPETALKIVDSWLHTEFEGGRHSRRVKQLDQTDKLVDGG